MGIGSLRNKNCWCGSGKKYKKCHLLIDRAKDMNELRSIIIKAEYDKIKKNKQTTDESANETNSINKDSQEAPSTQKTESEETTFVTPPDLGISVSENVKATPVFGRR